jgi:hypothetical protein
VPEEWLLRNVESVPGQETTAVVDRGAHPSLADQATIEVDATEFLKPAILEASDDARTWKEIGSGSIFATPGAPGSLARLGDGAARMTTLRFAPNDRRYWRLRLDDHNGAPIAPRAVRSGAIVKSAPPSRQVTLEVKRASDAEEQADGERASIYEVTLPSANLTVSSLTFAPTDAVFARAVAVSERVLVRDEITRRVLGGATIHRGPGGESLAVPLGELRGPLLEVRVEDGASPPLTLTHATATVAARSLLFFAPAQSLPVALEYGSSVLPVARYDLGPALAGGLPSSVKVAALGAPVDRGAGSPVGAPPHGAVVDESNWQTKAAIDLPAGGGVAYLPLEGVDAWKGLRLVDATSHEVPYVFEQTAHRARQTVQPVVSENGTRTTATLGSLAGLHELGAITLSATAPDYFVRDVSIVEQIRDARGPTGERVLGSTKWERRPGDAARPVRITIASPSQATIEVRIENGSNAPLTLGAVTLERSIRRIDFVSAPGDSLSLLTGSPGASAPAYDLSLLASALLSVPAQAAHLEPARDIAPANPAPAKWFWVAVIAAGLAVAAALARALKAPPKTTV